MFKNYICGVDIGSSKVAAAVAEIKNKRIVRIFFELVPLYCVKKGVITDSIELVGALSRVIKNLKAKSGLPVKHIYTNFSGENLVARHSRAVIPLAERGNKVITLSDMQRVNEHARILGSNLDEEIIHAIPISYAIDAKNNIVNPVGLYSHRLEADVYLLASKVAHLQSLSRIANQAGCEIKNAFFSGAACAKALFAAKTSGTDIVCDIGGDMTELMLYKDGLLRQVLILPVGAANLTYALQKSLNIPFDLAEEIKITHGRVGEADQISEDKEVLIKKNTAYKPIKQKLIVEIMSSEAQALFGHIKEGIAKPGFCDEGRNFIAAGRSILLEGFLESMENSLGSAIKVGRVNNPDIRPQIDREESASGHKYLSFLTSLGIIAEAFSLQYQLRHAAPKPARNIVFRTINRVKEVYQEYF